MNITATVHMPTQGHNSIHTHRSIHRVIVNIESHYTTIPPLFRVINSPHEKT